MGIGHYRTIPLGVAPCFIFLAWSTSLAAMQAIFLAVLIQAEGSHRYRRRTAWKHIPHWLVIAVPAAIEIWAMPAFGSAMLARDREARVQAFNTVQIALFVSPILLGWLV
jgi:hypothetical protein